MNKDEALAELIAISLAMREFLRSAKMFEKADKIREAVEAFGYKVEDRKKND